MKSKLAYPESIADLWGYPDCDSPRRPSTQDLFKAVSAEAEMCLVRTDWDVRIRRIENILSVIKERMRGFWEEKHASDLDRMVRKALAGGLRSPDAEPSEPKEVIS